MFFNKRTLQNLRIQFKESKLGMTALIIIVILVILSIFAFLSPYDANKIDVSNSLKPPSLKHIFGTDDMGRDYFTRALYGGRVSLTVGFLSMFISEIKTFLRRGFLEISFKRFKDRSINLVFSFGEYFSSIPVITG